LLHLPRAIRRIPCVDSEEQIHVFFHTEAAMNMAAVYQGVTQSIIAELEKGCVPWTQPWKAGKRAGIMPMNAITGHHYRGINIPILWHATDINSFPTNAWLTFKQALAKAGHVKKGEKAT
jgi:antirestriction protein ArdC